LLTLALFFPGAIDGQPTGGTISGFVTDPQGRAVAGAAATLKSAGGREWSARSDASGTYRFSGLPPDEYELESRAEGMLPVTVKEIRLEVHGQLRLDVRLAAGTRRDSVTVTAERERVRLESVETGAVIDQLSIRQLPLNRRDFLSLAMLAPGVAPPVEDSELSSRGAFSMHANGAREEFNNYMLDGVDNNDPNNNRYALQPPVDAIQEFRITTGLASAEFGRSAGAQVNVVTRQGTDAWHGFGYDYFRHRELDARNFFDGQEPPEYERQQFGGGIGGPVRRERTYFFANAEGVQERRGLTRLATVPGMAERQGDFSALGRPVNDPFTRAPFPGNRIPPARIAELGRNVLTLFPEPNRARLPNLLSQPVFRADQGQANGRLDHRLGTAGQLMARYSFGQQDLFEPYAEDSTDIPGFGDWLADTGHNLAVTHTQALNARLLHSARFGFTRFERDLRPENSGVNPRQAWGAAWLPEKGLPMFNVAGSSSVGDVTSLPISRKMRTYQVAEDLSLSLGRHLVKWGGEWRRQEQDGTLDLLTRGSLSFSGAISGAGTADLLLGYPSFTLRAMADNRQALRSQALSGYILDEWRLTPRLSLTLGLRYEYNTPPVDPADRMTAFDPATGKLTQVGSGGVPRSGVDSDSNNFAPRVGVSWAAPGGWVVRSGYGWFYDAGMLMVSTSYYYNPPYFTMRVYFPSAAGLISINDPFPTAGGMAPPPSLNTLNPDFAAASVQQWNLGVERRLAGGTVSMTYAGSKGTKLVRSRDLNQAPPGPGEVGARRPYPQYGSIFYVESAANSGYEALQVNYIRHLSNRVSARAAYTWGKSIDNTSAFLGTRADKNFPQNSYDYRAERGVSSFDVRQRVSAAAVWQAPGRRWWWRDTEFRGMLTAQTAPPLTSILRFDNSNSGNTGGSFGSDRPDALRSPLLAEPAVERWFDTAALPVAPRYTFGNAGRNILRGSSVVQMDVGVARQIPLGERARIWVECQAFNLFNTPSFDLPQRFADEPGSFGKVYSARAPRQIQLVARIEW
jgi:hypothetical protein